MLLKLFYCPILMLANAWISYHWAIVTFYNGTSFTRNLWFTDDELLVIALSSSTCCCCSCCLTAPLNACLKPNRTAVAAANYQLAAQIQTNAHLPAMYLCLAFPPEGRAWNSIANLQPNTHASCETWNCATVQSLWFAFRKKLIQQMFHKMR